MQAQSAKLIGEAIQSNPAFLTLRKIEVRLATGAYRAYDDSPLLSGALFDANAACQLCSLSTTAVMP